MFKTRPQLVCWGKGTRPSCFFTSLCDVREHFKKPSLIYIQYPRQLLGCPTVSMKRRCSSMASPCSREVTTSAADSPVTIVTGEDSLFFSYGQTLKDTSSGERCRCKRERRTFKWVASFGCLSCKAAGYSTAAVTGLMKRSLHAVKGCFSHQQLWKLGMKPAVALAELKKKEKRSGGISEPWVQRLAQS